MRRGHVLLLLLAGLGGSAWPGRGLADPLRSPACQAALDGLQAVERQPAARPGAAAGPDATRRPPSAPAATPALTSALMSARRRAAQACLGGPDDPPPPQSPVPPLRVDPVGPPVPAPPAGARPSPTVTPPAPVPSPPMPQVLTGCDALGCWTADGQRLPRGGPGLLGPRGPCSAQGPILHCP